MNRFSSSKATLATSAAKRSFISTTPRRLDLWVSMDNLEKVAPSLVMETSLTQQGCSAAKSTFDSMRGTLHTAKQQLKVKASALARQLAEDICKAEPVLPSVPVDNTPVYKSVVPPPTASQIDYRQFVRLHLQDEAISSLPTSKRLKAISNRWKVMKVQHRSE